jgi:hypothetical protein
VWQDSHSFSVERMTVVTLLRLKNQRTATIKEVNAAQRLTVSLYVSLQISSFAR